MVKKILSMNNVSFSYDKDEILRNICLDVYENEILCIKGKNGSGKTTLLKIISGILSPNSKENSYLYDNKEITFIPNTPYLYEKLTGRENIDFIKNLWQAEEISYEKDAEELLKVFSPNSYVDKLVETYSLGMKYKISLVAAISYNVHACQDTKSILLR